MKPSELDTMYVLLCILGVSSHNDFHGLSFLEGLPSYFVFDSGCFFAKQV